MLYSDHSLISFELATLHPNVSLVTTTRRCFGNLAFSSCLLSSKSICTSPPASADEFVKQLDSDVASVLDITAPFHTVTRRVSVRPRCNWVTPEARSAKRIARRLQRKYRRSKEEVDYVNWRRAGRKAVSEIKSARAKSLRDSI